MAKVIVLKYPAQCNDCGAELAVGTEAKWYGKGRIYGLTCHTKNGRISWVSVGANGKEYYQNYKGRCEDAPCCGCCNC